MVEKGERKSSLDVLALHSSWPHLLVDLLHLRTMSPRRTWSVSIKLSLDIARIPHVDLTSGYIMEDRSEYRSLSQEGEVVLRSLAFGTEGIETPNDVIVQRKTAGRVSGLVEVLNHISWPCIKEKLCKM